MRLKKVWTSPGMLSVLASLVQSLKMLIVAPLALQRISPFEMDIYYLFVGAAVITVLVRARLCDVFNTMLCYAWSGCEDLSPIKEGERQSTGKPNLPLFGQTMRVLARIEWKAVFWLLLISGGVAVAGLMQLSPIEQWTPTIWWALLLGLIGSHVGFVQAHLEAALMAMGRIHWCYRYSMAVAILFVLASCVAILAGAGLVGLLAAQVIVSLAGLVMMRTIMKLPPEVLAEYRKSISREKFLEIIKWAAAPLWKSALTTLATMGVYRIAGVFQANIGISGSVASFMFAQSILLMLITVAAGPLGSILPSISSQISVGKARDGVEKGCQYTGLAFYLILAGVLTGALLLPSVFVWMKSKTPFLETSLWLTYGILTALAYVQQCWATIYTRTNDMLFFKRYLWTSGLSLLLLMLSAHFQSPLGIILSITLPQLFCLGMLPLAELRRLSSSDYQWLLRQTFWPKLWPARSLTARYNS